MNLLQLTLGAMINISGFWLSNAAVRAVLEGHPLTAAMIPQLQMAHDLALALQQRRHNNRLSLARLTAEITQLDTAHDRAVRALYFLISSLQEVVEDPDLLSWLVELRARLFPQGLALVNYAYADEAGWARSVAEALTADDRARMASIIAGPTTMDELCHSWLQAGIALGERLLERAQVQAENAGTGPNANSLHGSRVRSTWIRTIQAVLNALDLLSLPEGERLKVLAPLHTTVELAERARAGADADADPDPDADTDAEAGADADADAVGG